MNEFAIFYYNFVNVVQHVKHINYK